MSEFISGLAARHDALSQALQRAFSAAPGFATADIGTAFGRSSEPMSFSPRAGPFEMRAERPRHFSPADPSTDPTAGWDPFEPAAMEPEAPFLDPIEVARSAGYDAGYADARAEAQAVADRDRTLLAQLGAALNAGGRLDRERMARQLRQTVLYLVTQLVGEIGIAPERLAKRIAAAGEMLSDAAESAMLRVNPADVALLDGKLPATIFAVGDAQVARGSFVLETSSTIVEDGPELWLEQLAHAIDRVAVPEQGA